MRRRTALLPFLLVATAMLGAPLGSRGEGTHAGMPIDPKRATQDFVNLLATGAYDEAYGRLDSRMAQRLSPSKLELQWKSVLAQAGPFEDIGSAADTLFKGRYIVDLTTRFQLKMIVIRVVWDSTGAVTGLRFVAPSETMASQAPANSPAREAEVVLSAGPAQGTGTQPPTATLSLPAIRGKRIPAVILVSTRDPKTLGDAAEALEARGIGVLRWDHGIDHGKWPTECAPALHYLQSRVEIDRRWIFLILESPGEAKSEMKNTGFAGVRTYPDLRLGGDEAGRLARWILGENPPAK